MVAVLDVGFRPPVPESVPVPALTTCPQVADRKSKRWSFIVEFECLSRSMAEDHYNNLLTLKLTSKLLIFFESESESEKASLIYRGESKRASCRPESCRFS